MGIRAKFLALLLVIALVPMGVVVVHDQWAARQMAENLVDEARVALTRRISNQLVQVTDLAAVVLRQQKELVELALTVQAREASRRLGAPPPPGDLAEPIYTDSAFDRLGADLPGMAPSARGGGLVSFEAPVFRLAPGVTLEDVGEEAARLSTMVHAFRGLRAGKDAVFRWQYVSLEAGLHLSYPGHGGYPEAYDARQRPWYRNALERGGLVWNPPYFDATTGQLTTTASTPLRSKDGSVIGVAGIDVDLLGLLAGLQERATLPPDADLLLVDLTPREETGKTGLRVLARRGRTSGDWEAAAAVAWLDEGEALAQELAEGKRGIRRLPFEGQDSLWAHAPVDDFDSALLIVYPATGIENETAGAKRIIGDATLMQVAITGAFGLFMLVVVGVLGVIGARAVTRPVKELDQAAQRLAGGDLEARAEVSAGGELGRLADSFNAMVPRLRDQVQLRQSLAVAAEVHEHLLPDAAPTLEGFDIAGVSLPCDETGGDYFDYLALSEGRLGIAVGDVTGHGLPAALLMATARGLLRARADRAPTASDLLDGVNRQLARDALAGRFMTLFYLVLTPGSRTLAWANAGHEGALVLDPESGAVNSLEGGGVPLGIDADWRYEDLDGATLPKGGVMVIATDGLWEARDADGTMFGRERLEEVLREQADLPASDLRDAVLDALHAFRGEEPLRDDVTLVVVRDTP